MKKIMFNDEFRLTDGVLEGWKTMTRRIVKAPKTWHGTDVYGMGPDIDRHSVLLYDGDDFLIEDPRTGQCGQVMPAYKIGETVAVAQSYAQIEREIRMQGLPLELKEGLSSQKGFLNKMFVRAEWMPHRIQFTDLRIEKLQDISEEDIIKEGIRWCPGGFYTYFNPFTGYHLWLGGNTPHKAFAYLIDKINGKGTWNSNPFVFAYEYELTK